MRGRNGAPAGYAHAKRGRKGLKIDEKGDHLGYRAYARAEKDKQNKGIDVPAGAIFNRHYAKQKQKGYQKCAKHI